MKQTFFFILYISSAFQAYSQTEYSDGFQSGYTKGYCHNYGIGCIAPIPPITPTPRIGESNSSYQDGYNRGFESGLDDYKTKNQERSNSKLGPGDRKRFETTDPKFVDFVENKEIDYKFIEYQENKFNELIEEFEKAQSEYNHSYALDVADEIIKMSPKAAIGYGMKSSVYFKKGHIINAYNFAVKSYELKNSNSTQEWVQKMTEELHKYFLGIFKQGEYEKLIQLCDKTWKKNDVSTKFKGVSYYHLNDLSNAKKFLKKLDKDDEAAKYYLDAIENNKKIENQPTKGKETSNNENIEEQLKEIYALLKSQEFNKSLEQLNKINAQNYEGQVCYLKGESYFGLEKYEEAITNLNKSISLLKGFSFLPYYRRALARTLSNDYYGANKDYDTLLFYLKTYENRVDKNSLATLYNNKAYSLVYYKKYDEAKTYIDKALSFDTNTDFIWDTKGEIEYNLGNFKESIDAMTKSINILDNGNSRLYRGLSYIFIKEIDKGCEDLKKAESFNEKSAKIEISKYCK